MIIVNWKLSVCVHFEREVMFIIAETTRYSMKYSWGYSRIIEVGGW